MACKRHKSYKAIHWPKTECSDCRKFYLEIHGDYDKFTENLKRNRATKEMEKIVRNSMGKIEKLSAELEAALAVKSSLSSFPIVVKPGSESSESTVIIVASDWHIEETVHPEEVNGVNEYNLHISKKRATQFWERALHLTKLEMQNTPIHTMVVALLGDFITGSIHEENLEVCSLRPVDAAIRVQSYLKSGIDFLLSNSELDLVVVCCPGNHSRITHKIRMATEEGNSLETFVYRFLAQVYEGNPRIRFQITPSYHNVLTVYDTRIRFHHGHSIRYWGGVGGITIPVNKAINEWNKMQWADLDVFGHFHQFFDGGNFIANGSMIGFNAYALRQKCAFEPPRQAFFVINKKWRTRVLTRGILFN